jgi:hypothetical protein
MANRLYAVHGIPVAKCRRRIFRTFSLSASCRSSEICGSSSDMNRRSKSVRGANERIGQSDEAKMVEEIRVKEVHGLR